MADPFSHRDPRPRVAVVAAMMAYFESIMEPGFRDNRLAKLARLIAPLRSRFEMVELGLWAEEGDINTIAARLDGQSFDVLLIVPTMASPPGELARFAQSCGKPVVIACVHELEEIDETYDMRALCHHSTNVGATMFGSMLRRLDPPIDPILVAGFATDGEFLSRVDSALTTAALANRLSRLRIGRLGAPMPGYDHLDLSLEEAEHSGLELIEISLEEWQSRHQAITEAQIEQTISQLLAKLLPPQAQITPSPDLDRAMRLALALDALASDYALDCGAIACRGSFGDALEQGAISCLATALLALTDRPFAATGDLVTAVAMWVGRKLGGATLYCELDAVDRTKDAFLVANTGEGDIAWCPPGGEFNVQDASVHSGRDVPGVVLSHDLARGNATMIGVMLNRQNGERLSLIALEGRILEPANTALKVTNGWFQSAQRPALTAFENWANAGATHHGSLSPGHLGESIGWLGRIANFPTTVIGNAGHTYA